MVSQDMAVAEARRKDLRWKWLLLTLCALGFLLLVVSSEGTIGFGIRPWYGFWDGTIAGTSQPYVLQIVAPSPGGAEARAGLRDGDRIDLRDQTPEARVAVAFQPMATRPTSLKIRRGTDTFVASVRGSTAYEVNSLWKFGAIIPMLLATAWFLGCALLITLRRSSLREARILALVLLCQLGVLLYPGRLVTSDAKISMLFLVCSFACSVAASLLLIGLSSRFGARFPWRRPIEWFAYAANISTLVAPIAAAIGFLTLRIDPLPYVYGPFWLILDDVAYAAVLAAAVAAVAASSPSVRPRAAWLLLPLPIALLLSTWINGLLPSVHSWFEYMSGAAFVETVLLLGALAVTYALLKRRVLDFEFVLSRTLVVAIVSLIVVMAFAVLEWLLGSFLAGASHATGLIANAVLAMVLGVSLRFIHGRVDRFVDTMMFRKRHEDERALRDFSQEAAFVTESDALLDQAVGKLRRHSDARSAALFVRENGAYKAVREFGEAPAEVSENDPAILALKTWNKPLDPHRYATRLRGDLALPMVSRGQLLGVLLCGERAGGEAYAPDEVDALAVFAHGVGSAFDGLHDGVLHSTSNDEVLAAVRKLGDDVAALRESMEQLGATLRRSQ